MRQNIPINEIIGRKVTNIFQVVKFETGGLDMGECFIELDNEFTIEIPWSGSYNAAIVKVNKKATSVFGDLADYPVYYVK